MTTSAVSRVFCDTLFPAHFKMRYFGLEENSSSAAAGNSALATLPVCLPIKARVLILRWNLPGSTNHLCGELAPARSRRRSAGESTGVHRQPIGVTIDSRAGPGTSRSHAVTYETPCCTSNRHTGLREYLLRLKEERTACA